MNRFLPSLLLLVNLAGGCTVLPGKKSVLDRPPYVGLRGRTLVVTASSMMARPEHWWRNETTPEPGYRYRLWLSTGPFELVAGTTLRVTGIREVPPNLPPWPDWPNADVLATVTSGPWRGTPVVILWGGLPKTAPIFLAVQ